jgi:hypothetical protein
MNCITELGRETVRQLYLVLFVIVASSTVVAWCYRILGMNQDSRCFQLNRIQSEHLSGRMDDGLVIFWWLPSYTVAYFPAEANLVEVKVGSMAWNQSIERNKPNLGIRG